MSKIVFLNLNGTLKEFGERIPQSSIDAVHMAQARGHQVCLSTGRTYQQIKPEIRDIGFDGIIANSGGFIKYHGDVIRQKYFTQLAFINMMQHLIQAGAVPLALNGKFYLLKSCVSRYYDVRKEIEARKIEDEMIPETDSIKIVESILDFPAVEKLLVFAPLNKVRNVRERWSYAFRLKAVHEIYEGMHVGEVIPLEPDRLKATKIIMDLADYSVEDSIAIGDGENERDIFENVGTAVAVETAVQSLKDVADFITERPGKGGIMKAFIRLGLIEG